MRAIGSEDVSTKGSWAKHFDRCFAAFKNRRCCGLEGYTCFCYKGSPGEGGVEYTLRVEISTSVLELWGIL